VPTDPNTDLKSGDHRRALMALRDILADAITTCEPNVVAQVAARLQSVLVELAGLPDAVAQKSKRDELKERRENRRPTPKAPVVPDGTHG
jgi:hypothetical protein